MGISIAGTTKLKNFLSTTCVGISILLLLQNISAEVLAEDQKPILSERPTEEKKYVLLVDKKSNQIELAVYKPDQYEIERKWHTTIGKVQGDKEEEGDLKTPEGVYFFTSRLHPPATKPKFGKMALYMNYPNPFDAMAGRTGFDIMLHATNEPERLKLDFDSEGCIVVEDGEILEISNYVELNKTPILVFAELEDTYRKPLGDRELVSFFENWMKSWESKDIETYIGSYHSQFSLDGRGITAYRKYKEGLNRYYDKIQVHPRNVRYFRHPKYSVIAFEQSYESYFPGGRRAFRSTRTKKLYVGKEQGKYKIIAELFNR